ncbi:MAG TPA: hypothetical protein VM345_07960 [Acidimicrobiales bacterium]|nr:hypothetical protein [Acidimicrobiales bacterium]
MRIWNDVDEATAAMEVGMVAIRERTGWDHSESDHKRVIHDLGDKVHLDVPFTRYQADGSVIGVYPAVYLVVETPEGSGIQCRSSAAP